MSHRFFCPFASERFPPRLGGEEGLKLKNEIIPTRSVPKYYPTRLTKPVFPPMFPGHRWIAEVVKKKIH